jgi:hypothetical protein
MTPFLSYILKSALCLSVFFLAYEVFLKKETFFQLNRIFLVFGLGLSFLIPAFPVASPFRTSAVPAAGDMPMLSAPPAGGFEPADLLVVLYAAGVLLFLVRFGLQLLKLRRVVRKHGIRRLRGVKIVAVDRLFSPFSFFDLIFLDPGPSLDADLRRILAHEQVHIRQHHTLDILLMEVALSLQWFNPFVWPYKKALQETHEYLADAGVIAQGFSSVRYQLHMFEQHVGAPLFEFGHNFKKSQIKRRIMMLSKIKSPASARLKLLLALPLALGLALAFAQPRLVAGTAAQDVLIASDHSKEKDLEIKEELTKLEAVEKALREKSAATQDEKTKKELEMKLKEIQVKRQKLAGPLPGVEYPPPPPPTPEEFKAMAKELQAKEEAVKIEFEKTTDEGKRTELKATLEKIRKKEESLKAMFDKAKIAGSSKLSVDQFKKAMAELDAKEKDVRAKRAQTTNPEEEAKLEQILKKIAEKRDYLKKNAEMDKASR